MPRRRDRHTPSMFAQRQAVSAAFDQMADFDGKTYERREDLVRLNRLLWAVYEVMQSGRWLTLEELSSRVGVPHTQTSLSARLRDFRKAKFGGNQVESRRRGDAHRGVFEYRLNLRPGVQFTDKAAKEH